MLAHRPGGPSPDASGREKGAPGGAPFDREPLYSVKAKTAPVSVLPEPESQAA